MKKLVAPEEYGKLADVFQRALDENRAKIMEPEMVIAALRIASRATEEGITKVIEGSRSQYDLDKGYATDEDIAQAILKHLSED